MRLPNAAHAMQPWRIHDIAWDFKVEDVWAIPTPGGPNDFPRLVHMLTSGTSRGSSTIVRILLHVRWQLGKLLGWDRPDAGLGARVASLRDRLPQDLRDADEGPGFDTLPFVPLYMTEREWAAEIANGTMHGVMHVGWVRQDDGSYRGQMAVLVKPNGTLGKAYMAAIRPIRHVVVYPLMMRRIGAAWRG